MYAGKSILITGGTGSFGQAFVRSLLEGEYGFERIVVFSRDELKQHQMSLEFSTTDYPQLRYFLGDVRDQSRLALAFRDIDYVVHAAALKQVPAAEYNPFEFVQTNVIGTNNVLMASMWAEVKRVVTLSTDKASAPANLYGATKLCADRMTLSYDKLGATSCSVVRYGNVNGSRGSLFPYFTKLAREGKTLPVTDLGMTRFSINMDHAVSLVFEALGKDWSGGVIVPKLPSYKLETVVQAYSDAYGVDYRIVGRRPGEKLHEHMISREEGAECWFDGSNYVILSSRACNEANTNAYSHLRRVEDGFEYSSGSNQEFLSSGDIENLIL